MFGKEVYKFIIVVFIGVKLNDFEKLLNVSNDVCKFCMKCSGMYLSLGDNSNKVIVDM